MNFTKTSDRKEIQKTLKEIIGILGKKKKDYLTLRSTHDSFFVSSKIFSFLNELYSGDKGLTSVLSGILLEHVYEAERICPGSAHSTISLINKKINVQDYSIECGNIDHNDICNDTLPLILDYLKISDEAKSIIYNAINMAGLNGKIFVEPNKINKTIIELRDSYNFSFILPIGPFVGQKKWERNWCRCLCIDGVIESLGEIDGILQEVSAKNIPIAIFARGFSSDIINTLKVNVDRGTLDILPISFGIDNLETINSVVDVSRVIGCDIVTPIKGDLISHKSIDDLVKVEKIICGPGNISIVNQPTQKSVELHLLHLSKRYQEEHAETSRLLKNRMRSLTGKCVNISVKCSTIQQQKILLDEIDLGLNIVRTISGYGTIHTQKLSEEIVSELLIEDCKIIPASLIYASNTMSNKFINCINSIEIAILND
jgi:hypothetical protein